MRNDKLNHIGGCEQCFFMDPTGEGEENPQAQAEYFLQPDAKVAIEGKAPGKRLLGVCRRHPPSTKGFPAVYSDDWCGHYTLHPELLSLAFSDTPNRQ